MILIEMNKLPTNPEITRLLRQISAAYTFLGENRFKIMAYDRAADSIEHLTAEAKDYWDDGKLADIPGVGRTIAGHLDELFSQGRVSHFEAVLKKIPPAVFPLLEVPGIGPKKAAKLVEALDLKADDAVGRLLAACRTGRVEVLPSFGKKSQDEIIAAISLYRQGAVKDNRLPLSEADTIAGQLLSHLKKSKQVLRADVLGSLRRRVATVGDIDIAVATKDPGAVLAHFLKYPRRKLIEKGPKGASVILVNGRQVDLRVSQPGSYGPMLQYFTGSKNHNIRLRTYALSRKLSLSEYGIRNLKNNRTAKYQTEEQFYRALGLSMIPPELREDTGEIEAAGQNQLPKLIQPENIRGDLHIHTDYNLEPSHDLGADPLDRYLKDTEKRLYEYLGINDHNPSVSNHTEEEIVTIMKRRKEEYEKIMYSYSNKNNKSVRVFIMCEVDIAPDGSLALPEPAFNYVDAVIVSVHSQLALGRAINTGRIIKALRAHPKVRILGHPTGRLLGRREGMDLDFQEIFRVLKENDQAIEINCQPLRLDLPDHLVREAVKAGVKLVLGTDSHDVSGLANMEYGVAVARRGWAEKNDILNSLHYNEFTKWLIRP